MLALCASARPLPARAAAPSPAILHLNWGGEPADLNPVTAVDQISFDVLNAVMQGLVQLGPDGRILPGIARRWSVADAGRTYIFQLRRARWSNGDPLTAQDFVYAWDQVLDPCNGAAYASQMQDIVGAAALLALPLPRGGCDAATRRQVADLEARLGVRAVGARTLVVHLVAAEPYWLGLTALPTFFPLDRRLAARWGMAAYGTDVAHMLFDGPFVIRSWVPNVRLDLAKNPLYWDAAQVSLAGVDGLMVTDAATAVNLYETGQLDVLTSIPSPFLPMFAHHGGYHLAPEGTVTYVEMNVRDPVLRVRAVRQALSLAIDRSALAHDLVRAAAPAVSLTPPGIDYAPGQPFAPLVGAVLSPSAQPAAARAALAAGLRQLHRAALPPLTLLTVNDTGAVDVAEALQAMWQQTLGVRVRLDAVDAPTYVDWLQAGRFQLAFAGWNADYDDPTTFLDLWTADSAFNASHWHSARYDQLLAAAAATANPRARGEDLARAERELLKQLPVAPLYWPERAWVAHRGVQGFIWYQTGPDFGLQDVRLVASPRGAVPATGSPRRGRGGPPRGR
jgi:oligopeptide transport system substrate-binding protein